MLFRSLGSITALNDATYIQRVVTAGTTFNSNIGLYINGFSVDLSSAITSFYNDDTATTVTGYADPAVCASLINAAQIPMVTASVASNGFITINTSSLVENNKLSVRSNGSNFLSMVGISVYELDQQIVHPAGAIGQGFASSVKYNPETETLLISSIGDDVYYLAEFDTGTTTFDQSSTRIKIGRAHV